MLNDTLLNSDNPSFQYFTPQLFARFSMKDLCDCEWRLILLSWGSSCAYACMLSTLYLNLCWLCEIANWAGFGDSF